MESSGYSRQQPRTRTCVSNLIHLIAVTGLLFWGVINIHFVVLNTIFGLHDYSEHEGSPRTEIGLMKPETVVISNHSEGRKIGLSIFKLLEFRVGQLSFGMIRPKQS